MMWLLLKILCVMVIIDFILSIIHTVFKTKTCYECVYSYIDAGCPAFHSKCKLKPGYHDEVCEKWRKF